MKRHLLLLLLIGITFSIEVYSNQGATVQNLSKNKGFIENKGQIHDQGNNPNSSVLYLLNRPGMNVQLRKTGFSYDTYTIDKKEKKEAIVLPNKFNQPKYDVTYKFHRVDVELLNTNPNVHLQSSESLPGYFNYYNGPVAATNVHHYKTVTYKNIYPNIDLVFTLNNNKAEYNFVVHPGGNVSDIQLEYKGMNNLQQKSKTELNIAVNPGTFTDAIPASYELESKKPIDIKYNLSKDNKVHFTTNGYNNNNTLIIDPEPALLWCTYYGGTGAEDLTGGGCAYGTNDTVYVTGSTNSSGNIATAGAYQTSFKGTYDAYIGKLDPNGTSLLWGTYYGGGGDDEAYGIVLDANNNSYITGYTRSAANIATPGAYQTKFTAGFPPIAEYNAFATKFNTNGNIVWGTYYGGFITFGYAIALDAGNNVYITGYTASQASISTAGVYQPAFAGGPGSPVDAYVAEINSTGSALTWATYYGGTANEVGLGIGVDGSNNVYISGYTNSNNGIASPGAHQTIYKGGASFGDIFVAKFNPSNAGAAQLLWGTYYGGTQDDACNGLSILNDTIYVTGWTQSNNSISTPGSYQTLYAGGTDGVIAKFDPTTSNLIWGTYYGDASQDIVSAIALDTKRNIYITGWTASFYNIATSDAFQTLNAGNDDAFITKFNPTGTSLIWGTFFGGTGNEQGFSISGGGPNNNFYISGFTGSTNLYTTYGTYQPIYGGGSQDVFIAKFEDSCKTTANVTSGVSTICNGSNTTLTAGANKGTMAYNYTWFPSVGLNTTTGSIIIASPPTTTNYTMTVTDGSRCKATAGITITISPPLTANAGSDITICSGGTATLSAAVGSTSYTWSPSTGLSSTTGSSTTFNLTVPGRYSYTLVTVNSGCISAPDSVAITVLSLPTFHISSNTTVCFGNSASLSASGVVSYLWSPSATLSSPTGSSVSASPTITSTYTVIGTDANGCSNDTSTIVNVISNSLTALSVSPANITICSGNSTSLTALGTSTQPPITYLWKPSSGLSSSNNAVVNATPTATMNYTVTGTDGNGCSNSRTATINIPPVQTIATSGDVIITNGASITIGVTPANGNIVWSPAGGLSCNTCSNPLASPTATTLYHVVKTDGNGCTVEDSLTVHVQPLCTDIFVPDAFSPNGDLVNDVLYIKTEITCVESLTFEIYDRWGIKAFSTTDPTAGWDGKRKSNDDCNTGIFVYYLHAKLTDGTSINKKGNISLIR